MRQMNHSSENNNNPIWSNFTFKKPKNQDNTVKTSIFYINDVHGQNIRMERLLTAVKQFDTFTPSYNVDKMKFASGDIMLGEDIKHLEVGTRRIYGKPAGKPRMR